MQAKRRHTDFAGLVVAASLGLLFAIVPVRASSQEPSQPGVLLPEADRPDFNGDRFSDLAVGVPFEGIRPDFVRGQGAVNVIYGSAAGLTALGDQFWHQNRPDIEGEVNEFDLFGFALTFGDFDGDGFHDLAVGVPGETPTAGCCEFGGAGAVNVIYGSSSGLAATGSQFWHQDSPGVLDRAEEGDEFGQSLVRGDFDGDGFDDLAIGVHHEGFPGKPQAGAVNVLYGSVAGLTATGNQLWHQDVSAILDDAERIDFFGEALTAADLNGDRFTDLAIGVSGEGLGVAGDAGAVNVLYGSATGLTDAGNQLWHQDSPGVLDSAEDSDRFGEALTKGDFNNDGFLDLAVGVPGEDVGAVGDAGALNVLYGSASGLTADGDQFWHQNKAGVLDVSEPADQFGFAVAGRDFDGDGFGDLAIGAPFEDLGTEDDPGAVNVLYGSASGLTEAGDQFWHQDSPGINDAVGFRNRFGFSLSPADFDGDGLFDLAVGVPDEDLQDFDPVGAVNIIYGSVAGLTATGDQIWHQDRPGISDSNLDGDGFGFSLPAR